MHYDYIIGDLLVFVVLLPSRNAVVTLSGSKENNKPFPATIFNIESISSSSSISLIRECLQKPLVSFRYSDLPVRICVMSEAFEWQNIRIGDCAIIGQVGVF